MRGNTNTHKTGSAGLSCVASRWQCSTSSIPWFTQERLYIHAQHYSGTPMCVRHHALAYNIRQRTHAPTSSKRKGNARARHLFEDAGIFANIFFRSEPTAWSFTPSSYCTPAAAPPPPRRAFLRARGQTVANSTDAVSPTRTMKKETKGYCLPCRSYYLKYRAFVPRKASLIW